jgi:membrane protease YdiL (CAAX protease family)
MSASGIAAQPQLASESTPTARSSRAQLVNIAWFIGLSLALALVAVVAGTPSALLPFILALGPTVIALTLAWREGHGALGRLRRGLTLRPPRHIWYLVLAFPVAWALATVAVGVVLGAQAGGLFDKVFPNVLIIFVVVLLPAFAEEVAWRGFAVPRLMTAMSPVQAALLIAVPWTLIHVGLFLPGQSNEQLLLWPLALSIASYSVILTWLFVRTGGSILMTALVHGGLNAMSPLMVGIDANTQWIIRNVIAAVVALVLIGLGGLRRPTSDEPGVLG